MSPAPRPRLLLGRNRWLRVRWIMTHLRWVLNRFWTSLTLWKRLTHKIVVDYITGIYWFLGVFVLFLGGRVWLLTNALLFRLLLFWLLLLILHPVILLADLLLSMIIYFLLIVIPTVLARILRRLLLYILLLLFLHFLVEGGVMGMQHHRVPPTLILVAAWITLYIYVGMSNLRCLQKATTLCFLLACS